MKDDEAEKLRKVRAAMKKNQPLLNRGNLRDIVIVAAIASVLIDPPSESYVISGFVILIIGSLLHLLVKGVLIRNSKVCQDGIYSVVRHPYYLANFVIDSALCVITGNLFLVFTYPFLFFWAYGPVMRAEEKFLESLYAKQHASFVDSTPQVFPHPHRWPTLRQLVAGFQWSRITPNEWSRMGRFWGVSFFLAVLQELRTDGQALLHWSGLQRDWDAILFVLLTFLLLAVSSIFQRKKISGSRA